MISRINQTTLSAQKRFSAFGVRCTVGTLHDLQDPGVMITAGCNLRKRCEVTAVFFHKSRCTAGHRYPQKLPNAHRVTLMLTEAYEGPWFFWPR